MARSRRPRDLAFGPHLRRRSTRFRLTALYCCLFFPSGVLFVAVTYALIVLVQRPTNQTVLRALRTSQLYRTSAHRVPTTVALTRGPHGGGTSRTLDETFVTLPGHVVLDGREFVVGACIVLVAMIGASVLLGWFAAGRVLRPLRVMTTTTRQISEHNLHERLALAGPDDELKDLGDTIDGLIARLEAAFESQRRFVANASHELRTPLMLSQTLLQVALADPAITLGSLRAACQEAVDAGKDQAQLIDALLTLARSNRGLDHREPVDLKAVVNDALKAHEPSAAPRGLQVDASLDDATVPGDARLINRLVSNLVDNAIRYNISGGRVEVKLAASTTDATLTVANTGPLVPPDQVSRLLEPFQRATPDRTAGPNGLGLGLSIVADIAEAHRADLDVRSRPGGGLTVAVSFPCLPTTFPEVNRDRPRTEMARPANSP
ncbi:MAG TPA: HAMP domain-containing sensor histidine kinase [Acidimicrobiales bacterium]|nr:HAMP domain-containing sensor histidine kinase [Acidimicrobiales bacterium]